MSNILKKIEKFGPPIFYLGLIYRWGRGPKTKNDEKHVKIDENHAKINKLNGFLPQNPKILKSSNPHGSRLLLETILFTLLPQQVQVRLGCKN